MKSNPKLRRPLSTSHKSLLALPGTTFSKLPLINTRETFLTCVFSFIQPAKSVTFSLEVLFTSCTSWSYIPSTLFSAFLLALSVASALFTLPFSNLIFPSFQDTTLSCCPLLSSHIFLVFWRFLVLQSGFKCRRTSGPCLKEFHYALSHGWS